MHERQCEEKKKSRLLETLYIRPVKKKLPHFSSRGRVCIYVTALVLFFVPLRVTAVILWLFASQRLQPHLCVHCACDRHMTRQHVGVYGTFIFILSAELYLSVGLPAIYQ